MNTMIAKELFVLFIYSIDKQTSIKQSSYVVNPNWCFKKKILKFYEFFRTYLEPWKMWEKKKNEKDFFFFFMHGWDAKR